MPNTFVSRSKLHARLFWITKRLIGRRRVRLSEAGKLQLRYYVVWA